MKYNRIILILILIIIIVLGFLIYVKCFNDKIIFTLFGDKEMIIYKNQQYVEYGYVAVDKNGVNLSDDVVIKTDLDTSKVGEYKINYSIRYNFKTYHDERLIKVVEDNLSNIEFKLKGSNIINLEINNEFDDPKFTCIDKKSGNDFSKYVVIENNINTKKAGIYEVIYKLIYQGKTKVLTRKIYIFEKLNTYSLSTTSITNKPISVNFKSNVYNFSHVVCPNYTIKNTKSFTYNFYENGDYTFYIYDTLNNYQEYTITINNIDKTAPSGTCKAILSNGKTHYIVESKDNDINNYIYNNDIKYTSKISEYDVSNYNRDAKVMLADFAGNKTLINCEIEKICSKPLNYINKKDIKYSSDSDSLKIKIMEKDGYFLSHIWAKDPYLQTKKEMLNEDAKKLMLPNKILQQAIKNNNLYDKIVWSSNASGIVFKGKYYDGVYKKSSKYNLKEPSSLLVYNGKTIFNDYDNYPASTVIYYINASNKLSYIPVIANKSIGERKTIFENALNDGIYNTFAFNAVLVKEKVVQKVKNDYYALRNGFCQLDENNFLSVVSDTRRWNKDDFAKFMASLGCVTAVNFDGGGSNALLYKEHNSSIIKTLTGNKRALSSIIYLTELE